MLDLETLGTDRDAAILTIGAVQFDLATGKTGEEFLFKVDPQSCFDVGGSITWSTLEFWMNQDEDAVKSLSGLRISIKEMLERLNDWVQDIISEEGKNVKIWTKGTDFDIGILYFYYSKFKGIDPVWKYWNPRDARTAVEMYSEGKEIENGMKKDINGVLHNAIDDCKQQIKYCSKIYKILNP